MFRKMKASDREVFLALGRDFYCSNAVLYPIDDACHLRTFDEMMRADTYLDGYLFEDGGENAGYALLNKTFCHEVGGLTVWVEELYVTPGHQGKGFGTAFLRYVEETYHPARIRLEVEAENTGAIALYTRCGYKPLAYGQLVKDFPV